MVFDKRSERAFKQNLGLKGAGQDRRYGMKYVQLLESLSPFTFVP
jgi:hypothetical protein